MNKFKNVKCLRKMKVIQPIYRITTYISGAAPDISQFTTFSRSLMNLVTYSSVVSRDSVRIALTIAALNGLKVMACDIQNEYLTADCWEKIWMIGGPEFGSEAGTISL